MVADGSAACVRWAGRRDATLEAPAALTVCAAETILQTQGSISLLSTAFSCASMYMSDGYHEQRGFQARGWMLRMGMAQLCDAHA